MAKSKDNNWYVITVRMNGMHDVQPTDLQARQIQSIPPDIRRRIAGIRMNVNMAVQAETTTLLHGKFVRKEGLARLKKVAVAANRELKAIHPSLKITIEGYKTTYVSKLPK